MAEGERPAAAHRRLVEERARSLVADCSRCFGLCCVAPAFQKSADFAIDKPAGVPCPNLDGRFQCRTHSTLRRSGFAGCANYDCLGAGQKVAESMFAGQNWRQNPAQSQIDSADGDARTRLPGRIRRPSHWIANRRR